MEKPSSASKIPRRRFMLGATAGLLAAAPGRAIAGATNRWVHDDAAGFAGTKWHEARNIVRAGRIGTLQRCQGCYDANTPLFEALATLQYVAGAGLPERVSVLGGLWPRIGVGRAGGIVTLHYAGALTLVLTPPLKGLSARPAVFRGSLGTVEVQEEVKVTLGQGRWIAATDLDAPNI